MNPPVVPAQRDAERPALRVRQIVCDGRVEPAQKLHESAVRHADLGLRRTAPDHTVGDVVRSPDDLLEDRRLADARFALQQERRRPVIDPGEQSDPALDLAIPTDDHDSPRGPACLCSFWKDNG